MNITSNVSDNNSNDHYYADKVPDNNSNDHNYADKEKFIIDQQYADDAGWIGEEDDEMNNINLEATKVLKERDLIVNTTKTELHTIRSENCDGMKNCKYLGSYLDTETDITGYADLAFVLSGLIANTRNQSDELSEVSTVEFQLRDLFT